MKGKDNWMDHFEYTGPEDEPKDKNEHNRHKVPRWEEEIELSDDDHDKGGDDAASMDDPSPKGKGRDAAGKRKYRLLRTILTDLLLVGVGLVIFALFHHVLPRMKKAEPTKLPQAGIQSAAPSTDNPSTTAQQPSGSDASADNSGWGAKFADKFAAGEPQITETSYQSKDISIAIEQGEKDDAAYYLADIYIRSIENFKTALAGEDYEVGENAPAIDIANKHNAILAMSGDYFGMRQDGIVIRNGELLRDTLFEDVLIMNHDGSMETYTADEFDLDAVKQKGAYQGWSFGPMLLDGGEPMDEFNSSVNPKNPRAAIGYYEPGHYCFLVVDGRQPGYSEGMTTEELSQFFYEKGCKVAYNLDGGQSASMVFMGKTVNKPAGGGRDVGDILLIAEK